MKPVTRWESEDGSIWNTPHAACARDELVEECAAVYADMGMRERPEGIDFSNGAGFLQQPTGSRERLYAWLIKKGATRDVDGPLAKVLFRAQCMDASDREWGQPYYASHPEDGDQVAR